MSGLLQEKQHNAKCVKWSKTDLIPITYDLGGSLRGQIEKKGFCPIFSMPFS